MKNLSRNNFIKILGNAQTEQRCIEIIKIGEAKIILNKMDLTYYEKCYKNGEISCILVGERRVDDEIKKGFSLIRIDDGYIMISFEELKPEDSEKMKEYGFRISFDENNILRCVEYGLNFDNTYTYLIGYCNYSNEVYISRSSDIFLVDNRIKQDDGFFYKFFKKYYGKYVADCFYNETKDDYKKK